MWYTLFSCLPIPHLGEEECTSDYIYNACLHLKHTHSDTSFLLKINGGWRDGLVGKVLALQVQGLEFKPQNPHNKSQVWCYMLVIPVLER